MPGRGGSFENGFTLIELLVAITVLALVSAALLSLFVCACTAVVEAGRVTTAVHLCRERIEEIKGGGWARCNQANGENSPPLLWEEEQVPDFDFFRRRTAVSPEELPGFPGVTLGRISVTVSWRQGREERSVTLETYLGIGGRPAEIGLFPAG